MCYSSKSGLGFTFALLIFSIGLVAQAQGTTDFCDPAFREGRNLSADVLKRIDLMCSPESSFSVTRIIRKGDQVTIARTRNGRTFIEVLNNVPEGQNTHLGVLGDITIAPRSQSSNESATSPSGGSEGIVTHNSHKRDLDQCVLDNGCDIRAYEVVRELTGFHSDAMAVSKCVASGLCDLDAYVFSTNLKDYNDEALEFSQCVKSNKCDINAYRASRRLKDFADEALELSQCVARSECDLEVYSMARGEKRFADESLEIAKCVKSGQCDVEVYLASTRSDAYHDEALEHSKIFRLRRESGRQESEVESTVN